MAFNKSSKMNNIKLKGVDMKKELTSENIQVPRSAIEIKEAGVEALDRLHPKTERKFVSIVGPVKNLWNVMFLLNKDPKYLRFLGRDIPHPVIKEARQHVMHVPYYWEIVALIALDRVLSDGKVVEAIENLTEEDLEKDVIILDLLKTGVITRYAENTKFRRLGNIYKDLFKLINANPRGEDILNSESKEEYKKKYKEWRLGIKEEYFNTIMNRINNDQLLKGLADTSNEEVKAKYLS